MLKHNSLYKIIFSLYPEKYRDKYVPQMQQTLDDMLMHETRMSQRVLIWTRELVVLPGNILEQHLIELSLKRHLRPRTLVDLIALSLLAPFIITALIDEFSEYFVNTHPYGSWVWTPPILLLWAFILPIVSLAISLIALILSILRARKKKATGLNYTYRLWPTIFVGIFAICLLSLTVFHDSVQCWVYNPTNALTHISQTTKCTASTMFSIDTH